MQLVSFVGLPGSGKSTIGRRLATNLGWQFFDTDLEVEREAGCSITQLFDTCGEWRFRELEEEVVHRVTQVEGGAVIATGGGAVLREPNRVALRGRSTVVYLYATPRTLLGRLRSDQRRPLLRGEEISLKIERLFNERDSLYRETCHLVFEPEDRRLTENTRLLRCHLGLE